MANISCKANINLQNRTVWKKLSSNFGIR